MVRHQSTLSPSSPLTPSSVPYTHYAYDLLSATLAVTSAANGEHEPLSASFAAQRDVAAVAHQQPSSEVELGAQQSLESNTMVDLNKQDMLEVQHDASQASGVRRSAARSSVQPAKESLERSVQAPSAEEDHMALSASFAARRDVAAAAQRQPSTTPEVKLQVQPRQTSSYDISSEEPAHKNSHSSSVHSVDAASSGASRTKTIPGRSPVTRKRMRGRRSQSNRVNVTARALKTETLARARPESTEAKATWSEPLTDVEALGRGKLDPNLPSNE